MKKEFFKKFLLFWVSPPGTVWRPLGGVVARMEARAKEDDRLLEIRKVTWREEITRLRLDIHLNMRGRKILKEMKTSRH